jgi:UDP-N-acetylmuramoyl-tripeptide--D-alanyl-D-alanine ligase
MNELPIKSLVEIISTNIEREIQGSFTGVSTDTRSIEPGQCFFAIKGEYLDGADYLDDAFNKGSACAVVNEDIDTSRYTIEKILKVKDSLKALGDFAHWYRHQHNFKVIAITGSVGKTTTKNIVHHILSKKFRTYQAPKNYEIAALSKIASPDIALITTVQPSHLEGFGTLENIAEEKTSIALGLKENAPLIINSDCSILLNTCRNKELKFLTFGKSPNADFCAENITFNDTSSTFTIQNITIYLPIPGLGAVENTIAAWAVCSRLEIAIEDFADTLKTIKTVPMRTQIEKISDLTVINDCYNANPASMKNALDILINFKRAENQRLVFICGDMAELGSQSEKLHAELGKLIADAKVDLVVAVGQLAKIAAEKATALAIHNIQTKFFPDSSSACNNLTNYINHDDIILIKGSRVANLELVVENIKNVFEKTN